MAAPAMPLEPARAVDRTATRARAIRPLRLAPLPEGLILRNDKIGEPSTSPMTRPYPTSVASEHRPKSDHDARLSVREKEPSNSRRSFPHTPRGPIA